MTSLICSSSLSLVPSVRLRRSFLKTIAGAGQMTKLKTADFITYLVPIAVQARRDGSPLFPSVRLAQNILETGCNLNERNNLGGFKVGGGRPNEWWLGATYKTPTWEVIGGRRIETFATWRSYASVYDFY